MIETFREKFDPKFQIKQIPPEEIKKIYAWLRECDTKLWSIEQTVREEYHSRLPNKHKRLYVVW